MLSRIGIKKRRAIDSKRGKQKKERILRSDEPTAMQVLEVLTPCYFQDVRPDGRLGTKINVN